MDDSRVFDDLPEAVWRSNGGQLIKNIAELLNGHTRTFQLIDALAQWDGELKNDQKRIMYGLRLLFSRESDGERLIKLIDSGNLQQLESALRTSYPDDRWAQDEYAKLAKIDKSLSTLANINEALREYITWFSAAHDVWMTAQASQDNKRMELPSLGEGITKMPADIGGDKIIHGKTNAAILAGTQQILRRISDAIQAVPDEVLEDFLARPNFREISPAKFKTETAQLPSAPQARAIERYSHRYMQDIAKQ